jgi:uncharacterized protein
MPRLTELQVIESREGVRVSVKAVPGAKTDRIVGQLGGALKIAITAAPERGQANRAIINLLAERLGIAASRITITRGHANPHKQLAISGMTAQELVARLAAADR